MTDLDRQTLDLEAAWWKYPGAKEQTIRELFDETPTRYYQRLNVLLDNPAALAYAPLTVKRLRRLRRLRGQRRAGRLRTTDPRRALEAEA